MVRDRTVIIGHLNGLLRALSVLISFSFGDAFYLLEQKKILGLNQKTEMFFFSKYHLAMYFQQISA